MRYRAITGRKSHSQKVWASTPLQHTGAKSSVTRCPRCGKGFKSISRVLMHLSKSSSCGDAWFSSEETHLPVVPENDQLQLDRAEPDFRFEAEALQSPSTSNSEDLHSPSPNSTQPYYTERFPGAGATKGHGKTFMDVFESDQFAAERQNIPFYPFATESEWETSSWLLRSGLSTRAIDEFFTLPVVSCVTFANISSAN